MSALNVGLGSSGKNSDMPLQQIDCAGFVAVQCGVHQDGVVFDGRAGMQGCQQGRVRAGVGQRRSAEDNHSLVTTDLTVKLAKKPGEPKAVSAAGQRKMKVLMCCLEHLIIGLGHARCQYRGAGKGSVCQQDLLLPVVIAQFDGINQQLGFDGTKIISNFFRESPSSGKMIPRIIF